MRFGQPVSVGYYVDLTSMLTVTLLPAGCSFVYVDEPFMAMRAFKEPS